MPLPVQQFPILSPAQMSPFGGALQSGLNAYSGLMNAAYLHPKLQEALLQQQLANQKSQAELPYAGRMAQATADYKDAMAKYLNSPNQALKNMTPLGKTYIEPYIIEDIRRRY